jgi:hypothetical protein
VWRGSVYLSVITLITFLYQPTWIFGEATTIAVNSQNHIVAYSSTSASAGGPTYGVNTSQLFEFNPPGGFLEEQGESLSLDPSSIKH